MRTPTFSQAFEVLCLQAADRGRGNVLFGESFQRARAAGQPFMVGEDFPDVYLEFPLTGDPFLDITVLLGALPPNTRIESPTAQGTEAMLDWYAGIRPQHTEVSCGYEIDTKKSDFGQAAVHFQPRMHTELVEPFCNIVGEPERARLYLELSERMPEGWPLSFFGMFRGRPGSPLRVCGYMGFEQKDTCANNPSCLQDAFDAIGFTSYDAMMLEQVSELLAAAPGSVDFQFDLYDDGTLGSTFAIDVQFAVERPELVQSSFTDGPASHVMKLLEQWGAADERWHLGIQATFAQAIPVELEDGSMGRYAFTLMPQWVKARWTDATLQPSKLYHLGSAGLL